MPGVHTGTGYFLTQRVRPFAASHRDRILPRLPMRPGGTLPVSVQLHACFDPSPSLSILLEIDTTQDAPVSVELASIKTPRNSTSLLCYHCKASFGAVQLAPPSSCFVACSVVLPRHNLVLRAPTTFASTDVQFARPQFRTLLPSFHFSILTPT